MRAMLVLAFASLLPAESGNNLMKSIRDSGLDPAECYRVRDVSIARDEAQFFLTDGYLIFGKVVGSTRVTAVFSADVEGGDGEILLMPPSHVERRALAKHTGTPNMEEHFSAGIFVFADDMYREIMREIAANPFIKKVPEAGAALASKWNPTVQNINGSFRLRLAMDLLSPAAPRKGFFAAALIGRKLGAFDVVDEPRASENIMAGQSVNTGFDIWTSFASRSLRNKPFQTEFTVAEYQVDSVLDAELKLHCVTHMKLRPGLSSDGTLPFEISRQMQVTAAFVNGEAAELLTLEEPRGSIQSLGGNSLFAVVPPRQLQAGTTYDVEVRHAGSVITDAGNHVYFVGSRGTWYPARGMQFARFDLTFHHPKELNLVSSGEPVDEHVEGEQRVTHRITQGPVRFAGFNLGLYETVKIRHGDLNIEVNANRQAEHALQVKQDSPAPLPGTPRRPRIAADFPAPLVQLSPSTTTHLRTLALDIADVMDFYAARFGRAPLKTLEVTPVPGRFGQGFAGMIYLSTNSYLESQELFFSDLLHAHEAAHQWWGNVVGSAGYHDDWLMEALANYSALLYLEKKKGRHAVDAVLDQYRVHLLVKGPDGNTVESSGPVVQGMRVEGNWSAVVYGKGTWIIHMLRCRLGDTAFLKMLADLRREYEDRTITTEEFRVFCAGFLPPKSADGKLESFFDQWVYGTGIPVLKLDYKISGTKVSGTVTQSGVDDDFAADVPVEIRQGRMTPLTVRVRVSGEPAPFSITAKSPATHAAIDTHSILSR